MTKKLTVLIEKGTDGIYIASVPALEGCHTQGSSIEQAMERIKEAIELCLESDEFDETEFIGVQQIEVA